MSNWLIFRLYGPMASWGNIAVGGRRPIFAHPTKSAILGMVAAALGIKRDEDERHRELSASVCLGICLERRGEVLQDYHTAQVASASTLRKRPHHTRRDELIPHQLNTILSQRDYCTDACYQIALWKAGAGGPALKDIQGALKTPHFVLCLGRKSCPPALPLNPQIVSAKTLFEAFSHSPVPIFLDRLNCEKCDRDFYWEELDPALAGMDPIMSYPRRDVPLSRRRWQFSIRDEFYYRENSGGGVS